MFSGAGLRTVPAVGVLDCVLSLFLTNIAWQKPFKKEVRPKFLEGSSLGELTNREKRPENLTDYV